MELVSKEFDVSKSIDFTELVKQSNTTQSLKLQTKMIKILNNEFTESEQQWFVANLYMYINYHPTNDYLINLENIFKMIGFANKGNAKRTLENNFAINDDYKITVLPRENGKNSLEEIMINTNTFKNLCMLAKTDKGKEIRRYYVKLENMNNQLIQEELQETKDAQNRLIQKLEYDNKKLICDKETEHEENIRRNRHNILIEKFSHKKCVYIAELDGNANLIKIGSTHNIAERIKDLCMKFGQCMFLQVFESDNFREVESNILHNELVLKYRYKELINDYQSKEVVKLSSEFNYKQLMEIVEKNVNSVNYLTPSELLKRYELDTENKKLDIIKTFVDNGESLSNIIALFDKPIANSTQFTNDTQSSISVQSPNLELDIKSVNQNVFNVIKRKPKGQQIQKIDPNNLDNIIETYDSMVFVLRSPYNKGFNKSSIQSAIKNSRIYKNHRWNFVGRPLNPTNEYNSLPPIRETIIQLNEDKSEILETFTSKDIAAKKFKIGKTRMRHIIKTDEKFNSCYFVEFSKCPAELLVKYNRPIDKPLSNNSKQIKQTHCLSNVSSTFDSLNEIYVKYGICSKTVIGAIENKTVLNGSYWEYV